MCLTSGGQAKAGWGTSGLVLGAGAGRPRGLGQPRAGRHGRARHLGLGGLGGLGVPGGLAHDGVYGEAELVLDLTFEEAGGEGGGGARCWSLGTATWPRSSHSPHCTAADHIRGRVVLCCHLSLLRVQKRD